MITSGISLIEQLHLFALLIGFFLLCGLIKELFKMVLEDEHKRIELNTKKHSEVHAPANYAGLDDNDFF